MNEATIFTAALEKTSERDRSAFLDDACAGNEKLRERVEALLAAHAQSDDILDAVEKTARTADFAPITEKPGSRIGPYRLMEQIGEGGFGVVFVAEQQEPVHRKVALKLIKPGMDSRQVIARFQAERQALAIMDHPNIARVLDAGATESGRPYFVMELVRGIPITEYCDKNHLNPRERIEIFVDVCNAIQHAHQKGIIHRDIKPSNVLVTSHDGKPVAKVIDFGVAKAIHQQLTDRTIYTQFAQMIGTPLYMSPEQAEMSGLDIDTRTDIYALGVLLYELFTGSTPLEQSRLVSAAYDEVRRLIREDEPLLPSQRISTSTTLASLAANRNTEPARLSHQMKGELDWIVMKALEKDRTRRYETASAFAADIGRYLRDEQVEACPPSTTYRLSKLIRRNRIAVTTSSIVAAALLCGVIVSGWFAVHAGKQGRLAEKARKLADSAREEAEGSEQTAVVALNKATVLNAELTKSKDYQRRMLYGAQMNLVQNAWEMDDALQVQTLLNATRQRPGEIDLRGIEWHYWQRKLHEEDRVLQLPLRLVEQGIRDLPSGFRSGSLPKYLAEKTTFSHDGRRLAAITRSDDPSITNLMLKVWSTESDSIEPIFSWNLPYKTGTASTGQSSAGLIGLFSNASPNPSSALDTRRDSCHIVFLDAERVVISASSELQTFRLDATAGAQPAQAHPPIKGLSGVKFNRDGSRIAATALMSKEGESNPQTTILILDGRTGEQIDQLPNPYPNATVLALSPDATRVVVCANRNDSFSVKIAILDAATRNSVTVSPRSMRFLNGSDTFFLTEFSPDGTRLAVDQPTTGMVAILDAATGSELFSIFNNRFLDYKSSFPSFIRFSPDGKWLTSISGVDRSTNVLKVWEAASLQLGTEFKGHTSAPSRVAFSADSKQLLVADIGCAVKVWRLPAKTASEPHESLARALAIRNGDDLPPERITAHSSDRQWTASAPTYLKSQESFLWKPTAAKPPFEIKLEDASGRMPPQMLPLAAPAEKLTFSPDGSLLVSVSVDGSVKLDEAAELKLWSVATGKLATLPPLRFRATTRLPSNPWARFSDAWTFFSPDSRRLVVAFAPSINGGKQPWTIRMWDLVAGRELPVAMADPPVGFLNETKLSQSSLKFSLDSKLFLIANSFSSPRGFLTKSSDVPPTGFQILDAVTGAPRWAVDNPVASPVFSSDASRLAGIRWSSDVAGGLRTSAIVVWDAATGKEVGAIPLPPNQKVEALAVSNKGSHVAVATEGSVTLYDVATATPLHVWDGMYSNVWFPPDGQRLVAYMYSNLRKEVKVWDVETRQEMLSRKFKVGQNSELIAASDQGTTTGLWSLPAQAEAEGLVDWLAAADGDGRFLTRSQIAEQIKTDPFVSAEARTISLKLASNVRRSAEALRMQASKVLNSPTQPRDEYQLALDWISEAVEQDKENSSYASYQGFAYYRLGQYADSLTALARCKELHAAQKLSLPAEDLTVLAMAQHQAGQPDEARTTLEQARTSASRNKLTGQKLLAEAETRLGVPRPSDNP